MPQGACDNPNTYLIVLDFWSTSCLEFAATLMKHPKLPVLAAFAVIALSCIPVAEGALSLNIDTFNSTTLTFTVSGTLDAPTAGAGYAGVLAVSPDEFGSTAYFNTSPIPSGLINIAGTNVSVSVDVNTPFAGYAITFHNGAYDSLPAGTAVSGTVTLTGNFTDFPTLYLWSGFDGMKNMNRIEATGAIPEPSAILLGGVGALALIRRRKR